MALKAVLNTEEYEALDPAVQELFSEKGDNFELTGVQGIKTEADVQRLRTSIEKERTNTKAAKAELREWTELGELAEVQKSLDRIPELESAAEGKLDDASLDELAEKRAAAISKTTIAPLERTAKKQLDRIAELETELKTLNGEKRQRLVHDDVREAIQSEKLNTEYHEDVLMHADRIFEITDEGNVVTKDGVGVTPGINATDWLQEMQPKRPGWWPGSRGAGARGSGAGGFGGTNPWTRGDWNMTEQGRIVREKGEAHAEKMAVAAGTKVGGMMPAEKK